MQGDTTIHNARLDTNNTFFVFCKPDTSIKLTKADSILSKSDSLSFRYFFDYSFKKSANYNADSAQATRKSMFTTHQLQVKSEKPYARQAYQNDWIVLILLLCFSLLAWVLIFSRKRVMQIISATFTNRTINQLIRDGDLFKERIAVAFAIIYYLIFTLFLFQASHYYLNFKQLELYTFLFYLKMLAAIFGFHLFKQLVTKFIGNVFKNNSATYVYLLNVFIFNIFMGLILLPLVIFMVYSKGPINSFTTNLSIGLVVVLYVIRYIRSVFIGVSFSKFSHIYLFLYLCTLEILPVLILIKIIIGLIDSKM